MLNKHPPKSINERISIFLLFVSNMTEWEHLQMNFSRLLSDFKLAKHLTIAVQVGTEEF